MVGFSAVAAPVSLSHSGRLLDVSGTPIDGDVSVSVQLFDAASGGNLVWADTYATPIAAGYYSLVLTGGTPSLDSDIFTSDLWIVLSIGGGVLGERQPLHRLPMAAHAMSVSGGAVVVPDAVAGNCGTVGALARDASTGALRVCHDAGGGLGYVDVASSEDIQALIDSALGTSSGSVGSRVKTASSRSIAFAPNYTEGWSPVGGMIIPFTSRGGPIQVNMSLPINGGSTSSCRSMIDGLPASLYTKLDSTYFWVEGLENSSDGWMMWDAPMLFEGVAEGRHTLHVECHTDSASAAQIGNTRMTRTLSVIAYDPVETASIKAQSDEAIPNVDVGTGWAALSGLAVPFEAAGGNVRMSWGVPMQGGSHSACRPRLNGTLAGAFELDTVGYRWSEGLVYTLDGWNMHNRTRMYGSIPAGTYTATLECSTDSGTVNIGNDRMGPTLSVTAYPSSGAGATPVFANTIGQQTGNFNGTWTDINGLETPLNVVGGPVEIGVSIPMTGGSHAACRPTLDGEPIQHPVDDLSYIWHDGLIRTSDGWGMWDRVRVYDTIESGSYTLGVQCIADSTATLTVGVGTPTNGGTNQVWAIPYSP
ncbi:MAG: hypothetical protein ACJAZO_002403 [Myxococcota bacterium]|jgi:hypothetical protein